MPRALLFQADRHPIADAQGRCTRPWYMWFMQLIDEFSSSGGDVFGPNISVNNEIALFSGTTGKLLTRATGTGIVNVINGVFQTPYTIGANLTVIGTTLVAIGWAPMYTGAEPAQPMTDGAGNALMIGYQGP